MKLISVTFIRGKVDKFRLKLKSIYYFLTFTYAFIKTFLWGYYRVIYGIFLHPILYFNHLSEKERRLKNSFCFSWDRWESPEPIHCPECEWAGQIKNLIHIYYSIEEDNEFNIDVELVDWCPNCGVEL